MSEQPVISNQTPAPEQHLSPARSRPSPFIGAASIVLGAGAVVLGLVGRALKGSVKLLLKSQMGKQHPRSSKEVTRLNR